MPRLLIIRHGIAEETSRSGRDFDRGLTEEGRARVAVVGKELARLELVPDLLVSSPLVRAVETRRILGKALGVDGEGAELPEFAPDGETAAMFAALRTISRADDRETIAVVGHLPSAPSFIAAALGSNRECIELKKAGVALIDFPGAPAPGRGVLELLLAPRLFR